MKRNYLKSGIVMILIVLSGAASGNTSAMGNVDSIDTLKSLNHEPNPNFTMEDLGFSPDWNERVMEAQETLKNEWTLNNQEIENSLNIYIDMFKPAEETSSLLSYSDLSDDHSSSMQIVRNKN